MVARLKMRSFLFFLIVLMSPLNVSGQSNGGDGFTSAHVAVASTQAALECADYCVVGACFWLVCKLFSCDIETSLKIAHNRPDLVVSTYNQPGDITYKEAGAVYGSVLKAVGGAAFSLVSGFGGMDGGDYQAQSNIKTQKHEDPSLKFKEASIIGSLFAEVEIDYMCESAADAFQPYFQSELDSIAWRFGTDTFNYKSWLLGVKEVGDWPFYSFGPIYPRSGFLMQKDDAKAGAVFAARGMEVLKEGGWGHVRKEFTNEGAKQKEHEILVNPTPWQPIYPHTEGSCMVLGSSNDPSWLANHRSDDQKRGWIYWPRYKCCLDNKGIFLGSAEFSPVCI